MKTHVFFVLLILFTSCASRDKIMTESTISASYQTWVGGVRGGGSGINFYLELKSDLPRNTELKRLIFRGFEVPFEKQDPSYFQAMIKTAANQQNEQLNDLQMYTSPKNALTLADDEAVLVFLKNGKEYQQKISNVKEKPGLEYPSARPKF